MVGRLKTSSRKFPVLMMCYPTLTNVSNTTMFAAIQTATAKQHTKTHSLRIPTDRSIRTLQVSRNKIEAIASIKVTQKPHSVIRTAVSTHSTAILHIKSQTIQASVVSTRMPSKGMRLSRNKCEGKPSSSAESMSITRRCGNSRRNIGRVIHQTSSSGDQVLAITTRLTHRSNSG